MAGTKISALTSLTPLVDTSVVPVVDSGNNYKITGLVLSTYTTSKIPTATTSTAGLIKIDNNSIVINNGVISVGGALTSATIFKGSWDASTNTPTLSNTLPAGAAAGWEYIVSVGATRDIGNGSTVWSVGDLVIYDGSKWVRIPGGNSVASFNTRQGAVTLTSADVTTALGGAQAVNTVFAGPSTGGSATPTYRALVVADLPTMSSAELLGKLSDETGTGKAVFATSPDITTSITTPSTTFSLVNTNATTVNFAGAGTTIAVGAISGTLTLKNPTVVGDASNTTVTLWNTVATTVNAFGAATAALKIGASGAPITGFAAPATSTSTAASLGYLGLPQNATGTATLTIADAGKHIYITSASQTITIPAASSVAYPIGTTITFIAGPSATTVTIAITSDTMYLAGAGTTGSRTLAAYGMATAVKVSGASSAGVWYINGSGLT